MTITDEQAIDKLLKEANGRRRVRTLTLGQVLRLIDDVKDGHEWSTKNGGTVPNVYGRPADTTVALAARVEGRIYLGIGVGGANAVSPGRAWKCLQQWNKGDMTERFKVWINQPNVILIEG